MGQLNRVHVEFDEMFANGAFLMGITALRDFALSTKDREVQQRDLDTGELLWIAECIDGDMDARGDKQFKVKIAAAVQPVPPPAAPGTPFRPVEFEGLRVTAWIDNSRCTAAKPGERHQCRARQAVSYSATGLRAPFAGLKRPAAGGTDGKAA
jgi:hypothetical protein